MHMSEDVKPIVHVSKCLGFAHCRYNGQTVLQAFAKPSKFTSMINVLLHAFGGLSTSLQPEEKRFFLNSIEKYRDERIPLSTLIHLIEAWLIAQKNAYLLQQTFFRPFPRTLVEITDSGKGRKL